MTFLPRFLSYIFILSTGFIFLSSCEGGKSRSTNCDPANPGREPYVNCGGTPTSCPSGQQLINGVCANPGSGCPIGSHSANGECVPNGLSCAEGEHQEGELCVADQLEVEIVSRSACWNPENGATRLVVQFITRDEAGRALDPALDANQEPTALTTELYIDERKPNVESILSRDSELLKSNLALSLVLDGTYSMLQHNPPAFEPMKTAAVGVVQEIKQLWDSNQSVFHWELTWFDERIYRPALNNRGAAWEIDNISSLPAPTQGQFTGLWKAVHYTIGVHEELLDNEVAAGARDQHVMIVFSDGDDNHSFFGNDTEQNSGTDNLNNNLFWTYTGYPSTDLDDVKLSLSQLPNLRVYVIAFGDSIGDEGKVALQSLASQSRGQYFFGSGSESVAQLFEGVKREFITMQTVGVETPLPPGSYEFSVRAKHIASAAEGKSDFTLDVDSTSLGNCTTE